MAKYRGLFTGQIAPKILKHTVSLMVTRNTPSLLVAHCRTATISKIHRTWTCGLIRSVNFFY
jgi:hypothetical protein